MTWQSLTPAVVIAGAECLWQRSLVVAAPAGAQFQLCLAGADESPHAHAQAAAGERPQGLAPLPAPAPGVVCIHGALPGECRADGLGEHHSRWRVPLLLTAPLITLNCTYVIWLCNSIGMLEHALTKFRVIAPP